MAGGAWMDGGTVRECGTTGINFWTNTGGRVSNSYIFASYNQFGADGEPADGGGADGISFAHCEDGLITRTIAFGNSDDGYDLWGSNNSRIEFSYAVGNGTLTGAPGLNHAALTAKGFTDEKIAAIWTFEESPLFTDAEKAALRLALHAGAVPNTAEAKHFDDLRQHFNEAEIVEIVASVALFGYLNRWNDTMATEMEDVPGRVAVRTIGSTGWTTGKHGPAS